MILMTGVPPRVWRESRGRLRRDAARKRGPMFELLTVGAVLMCIALVFGLIAVIFRVVFWFVFLPFRLVGIVFKLAFGVLLLPVLAIAGIIGLIGLGIAAVFAVLLPLVPVVLAVAVVWWLAKLLARPAIAPPPA
jgi:hypothetical protein